MLVIQATQSNQHRRVDMFLKLKRMAIKIRGEYLSSRFSKNIYIRILTTINIQAEFRQIKSRLLYNHFYTNHFYTKKRTCWKSKVLHECQKNPQSWKYHTWKDKYEKQYCYMLWLLKPILSIHHISRFGWWWLHCKPENQERWTRTFLL